MSKKKRRRLPWWRKAKVLRRLAIAGVSVALLAAGGWYVMAGSEDHTPPVYLIEAASPFSLPAIDSSEVVLRDHAGKHNMLLYFNEGMG